MFKIHAGVSAEQAEARIAHNDLDRSRNEISLNVKKLYYGLLSTQERQHAAELRVQAGETRLKEAKDAAQTGVVLQVKILEGEAEIADARHQLGSLEDQIADLTNSFNDVVGLPLPTNTELIEPVEQPDEGPAAESPAAAPESQAMAHNPELLSAQQALAKAHAGVNAARAEYIPDISLFAQHVYQNGVPLLPASAGAFGLRMDWTISEFGKRIGLVRERKAQLAQDEENLGSTERKVRMDVQSETRKVHRSETGLEAARESVAVRTELVRITNDQFVAKTATESALKDAQAQLADAKAQLFDAQMQRVVAQAELLRTVGRQ
jgi:outer membrane protein TolC